MKEVNAAIIIENCVKNIPQYGHVSQIEILASKENIRCLSKSPAESKDLIEKAYENAKINIRK